MKTIEIEVPGMQSSHCQLSVKNTLSNITGVELNEVTPGQVKLKVDSESTQAEVIDAIEKAGYEVKNANVISDELLEFKTNINCSGCVAKVSTEMDNADGICHWEVDTNSKDKILTVHSEGITEEEVMTKVKKAGFNIEKLAK